MDLGQPGNLSSTRAGIFVRHLLVFLKCVGKICPGV